MCFSQYAQYAPRPVIEEQNYQYEVPARPEGAPPTKAELDNNLFGPKPMPPQWQQKKNGHVHNHSHNGPSTHAPEVQQEAPVGLGNLDAGVAAIVVELTNGIKLRVSISQE